MLKPSVGETVLMSPPLILFRIVVFPALSRPLWLEYRNRKGGGSVHVESKCSTSTHRKRTRISRALALFFLMMVRSPAS